MYMRMQPEMFVEISEVPRLISVEDVRNSHTILLMFFSLSLEFLLYVRIKTPNIFEDVE